MIFKWNRTHVIALILVVLLAIALTFIGYFTYVVPLEKKVSIAEDRLVMQEKLLATTKQEIDSYDDSNVTTEIQKKIPIEKATDQVVFLLNDVAIGSNSTITQVSVSENIVEDTNSANQQPSDLEELRTIQYQLQVSAEGYESMHKFLEELNAAERLLNIEQLEFNEITNEGVRFSVTVSAYYSPALLELLIEAPSYNYEPSARKTTPFFE